MACEQAGDDNDWFDKWTWRNCRSLEIGFSLLIFPWDWHIQAEKWDCNNTCEWKGWAQFGPIVISLDAHIGNVSSESRWRAWFGLSEDEAWERSCKVQRRAAAKKERTNV